MHTSYFICTKPCRCPPPTPAAGGLAADPGNARLAGRVRGLWQAFTAINSNYIKLKVGGCASQKE